ncbi:MAG: Vgb family protein, partial [Solirubrobacteraceae bacterium]
MRTVLVTLALLAAGIAAPSAQALSIVQHPLNGKGVKQNTLTHKPVTYTEALAITGFSGGLIVTTEPTESVYDVVTTSPFSITQSEKGAPATSIAIGPGGVPWLIGSQEVTVEEPETKAPKENVEPSLFEGNPAAAPPSATPRYSYPSLWNRPYGPAGLTLGSDGALWVIDPGTESIERYVPGGKPEPHSSSPPIHPTSIVSGPEGALWFTDVYRGAIGRAATSGEVSEHLIEDGDTFGGFGYSGPYGIVAGPEGALWFTEQNTGRIARYTPSGQLTEYAIPNPQGLPPGASGAPAPRQIVYGPEGAFWFTDPGDRSIGRITTSGAITEYEVPPYTGATSKSTLAERQPVPDEIAVSGSGEVWFTEVGVPALGSVDVTGTEAASPAPAKTTSGGTSKSTCLPARSASAGRHVARGAKSKRGRPAHGTARHGKPAHGGA